jgi:hypothetical protein
MTSLWKMTPSQISKLKAGNFVEAGTRCRGDSTQLGESESRSDIPPPWDSGSTWALGAVPLSGHSVARRLRRTLRLAVRDCQGLWAGTRDQGPAPGLARAGASPWSLEVPSQISSTMFLFLFLFKGHGAFVCDQDLSLTVRIRDLTSPSSVRRQYRGVYKGVKDSIHRNFTIEYIKIKIIGSLCCNSQNNSRL